MSPENLRHGLGLAVVALVCLATPTWAAFDELGAAGDYSLLGLGKPSEDALGGAGSVDLASSTVIGDAGIGAYGTLDFEGPATIKGDLYLDPLIKNLNTSSGTVTGSTIYQDLSGAVSDALDAADYYASLVADQTFGKIDSTTVIFGNGGLNVIEIAAIELDGLPDAAVLAAGTDGTDGPTDAAGAYADGETCTRAATKGLDAADFLARNDSYHFFESVGQLLKTGPTGTNVMDLYLFLVGAS